MRPPAIAAPALFSIMFLGSCMAPPDTIVLGNCKDNSDCGANQVCRARDDGTRECRGLCSSSDQCAGSDACTDGVCEPYESSCTGHYDCVDGFYCADQTQMCMKYPFGASTCDDDVRGATDELDESDVDCGGPCPACPAGQRCFADWDCDSGVCDDGVCAAPTCSDGVKNGFESDIDCGGSCDGCANGKPCVRNADCAATNDACVDRVCNHCGDGVARGNEQCDDSGDADDACAYGLQSCSLCGPDCAWVAGTTSYCGDNRVDPDHEVCDQPGANSDDYAASAHCNGSCTAWAGFCGDGVTQAGNEDCDDQGDSMDCDPDCTARECGDGYINEVAGEECEPPQDLYCSAACKLLAPLITTSSLPPAIPGLYYGPLQLEALGGTPPYAWTLAAGSPALPPWVSFANGVLEGAPADTGGGADVAFAVTDDNGKRGTRVLRLEWFPIKVAKPDQANWSTVEIATDGEALAIGAPADAPSGVQYAGSVYLFSRDQDGANRWGFVKKLTTAGTPTRNGMFGYKIAIDNGTLAVTTIVENKTHIFQRDQGGTSNWGWVVTLPVYAGALALRGDTLALGLSNGLEIRYRDQGGPNSWGIAKTISWPNASTDGFGEDLSLEGDTLVAGARRTNDGAYHAGAAYVFLRNKGGADNWAQAAKLQAPSPAADDVCGRTGVAGAYVVMSCSGRDAAATDSGAAFLFVRNGESFTYVKQLSDTCRGFVSAYGDTVALTTTSDVVSFRRDQGGIGNWGATGFSLVPSGLPANSVYGEGVSVSGNTVAIGQGSDKSVWIYRLP